MGLETTEGTEPSGVECRGPAQGRGISGYLVMAK